MPTTTTLACSHCPEMSACQTAWEIYVLGSTLQTAGATIEIINLTCPKVKG